MNSVQIKCFLEAAKCGNFTKAAEHLYMSQPALSKNIAALEAEFQVKLFVREPHHATSITPAGQILYDCLLRMTTDFSLVLKRAQNIGNGMSGTVMLGILEGQMLDDRLKNYIDVFEKEYPQIRIQMKRGSFRELTMCLDKGELDAIVTLEWEIGELENVECCELYRLPTKLIIPKNSYVPMKKVLSLKDFEELTFICVSEEESHVLTQKINTACQKAGFMPKLLYTQDMWTQILALERGQGMAGFNAYHMICHSPNVTCIDVAELLPQRFVLCFKKNNTNPCIGLLKKVYYEVFT